MQTNLPNLLNYTQDQFKTFYKKFFNSGKKQSEWVNNFFNDPSFKHKPNSEKLHAFKAGMVTHMFADFKANYTKEELALILCDSLAQALIESYKDAASKASKQIGGN